MKKAGFLAIIVLFLLSCSGDDDNVSDVALNGEWILNRASCFCFFEEDFDFSGHTLTFNSIEEEVVVKNSDTSFFITQAGTYSFANNGTVLDIDGRKYTYRIEGNTMVLTFVDNPNIADDEIALFYTKG
jgi:hypothetical protein